MLNALVPGGGLLMETVDKDLDKLILSHLGEDITNPKVLQSWLDSIRIRQKTEDQIRIIFGSRTQARYFQQRFGRQVKDALEQIFGPQLHVSMDVEAMEDMEQEQKTEEERTESSSCSSSSSFSSSNGERKETQQSRMERIRKRTNSPTGERPSSYQSRWGSPLRDDFRFENFVVGKCNRLPHAACKAIKQEPGNAYNPLFIHGGVGLGKTHLLQALCHSFLPGDQSSTKNVLYLSCEEFVNHYVDCLQNNRISSFRDAIREIDVLLIDDVQFLGSKQGSQEEFFHSFNTLYNTHSQIVLTSDSEPDEISGIQDRLCSRFGMGLVVRMDAPDLDTCETILNRKSQEKNLSMTEESVSYVTRFCSGSIRKIESCVSRLEAHQNLKGLSRIDVDRAKEILQNDDGQRKPDTVPIRRIVEKIASFFDIDEREVTSDSQRKDVSEARHIGLYLSRQLTNHSLSEIGGFFGGKDHSTVHYAVKKISRKLNEDRQTKLTVQHLREDLTSL